MHLDLNDTQTRELARALDLHLNRMMDEIVHTEDREFQDSLKATYDVLDGIRRELAREEAIVEEFA